MRRGRAGGRLHVTRARHFFLVFGEVALYALAMWIRAAILALLVVAAVPAFVEAGAPSLRGLGWLVVVIGATVLLIDLTDRLTEWVERRRWGRRR
jgi:hypothetical protein